MFCDEERDQALMLNLQSPAWNGVDHLFNPDLPKDKKLGTRELFCTQECLDSYVKKLNVSLLTALKNSVGNVFSEFQKRLPLEKDKPVKAIKSQSEFFNWLKATDTQKLSLACSPNFVLFKPFDESALMKEYEQQRQDESLGLPLAMQDFAATYWLSAWRMAGSHPLNCEMVFGLSAALVKVLKGLESFEILKFLSLSSAQQFQLRHRATVMQQLVLRGGG